MSDQNHKKDPLEQFFYKKSSEFDIPYNEKNWLSLEKKLDKKDKLIRWKKIQFWLIAASFLIIAFLSFVMINQIQKIDELNELLNEQQVPNNIRIPSGHEIQPLPHIHSEGETITEAEESDGRSTVLSDPTSPTHPVNQTANQSGEIVDSAESVSGGQMDDITADLESMIHYTDISDGVAAPRICSSCIPDPHSIIGGLMEPYYTLIATIESSQQLSGLPGESHHPSTEPFHQFIQDDRLRVSFGAVTGPDLSTVGSLSDFTNPGYQLGLTAEINIYNKISLTSGIIRAKVRYQQYSQTVKASSSYGNEIIPDLTSAVCSLLNIPLKVKYNVLNFRKSNLYATAGLSSYIMLQEDYQFYFQDENQQTQNSWSGRTGTSHWFSNVGFSIGYEVDLMPQWSIRMEPYLNVPISEVGWGNARLYSVGSYFSLNFNI
jgi:hypothetical protein